MRRARIPGDDLVEAGLADLGAGIVSEPALLVSIGAPRLQRLGIVVPPPLSDPEHRLYTLLAEQEPDAAHSRYNALIRRLVSFERALASLSSSMMCASDNRAAWFAASLRRALVDVIEDHTRA